MTMADNIPGPKRLIIGSIAVLAVCLVAVWLSSPASLSAEWLPEIQEKSRKTGMLMVYISALFAILSADLPLRYKLERERLRRARDASKDRIDLLEDLSSSLPADKFTRLIAQEKRKLICLDEQDIAMPREALTSRVARWISIMLLMLGTLLQVIT
ncbi:hypothetical protein LDO32_14555 [Luteimonas sp. Y-2-2-4F]|nr:hypothetical protein [Luteimonas sp. Y-2-2-4F]MCD9032949.1 hypothetical protein [Luteimonas sp. Y-2-2-4F]